MDSDAWIMEMARKYVHAAGFAEILDMAIELKYRELKAKAIAEDKRRELNPECVST